MHRIHNEDQCSDIQGFIISSPESLEPCENNRELKYQTWVSSEFKLPFDEYIVEQFISCQGLKQQAIASINNNFTWKWWRYIYPQQNTLNIELN